MNVSLSDLTAIKEEVAKGNAGMVAEVVDELIAKERSRVHTRLMRDPPSKRLDDDTIDRCWPDMAYPEGRAEIRRQFDELMSDPRLKMDRVIRVPDMPDARLQRLSVALRKIHRKPFVILVDPKRSPLTGKMPMGDVATLPLAERILRFLDALAGEGIGIKTDDYDEDAGDLLGDIISALGIEDYTGVEQLLEVIDAPAPSLAVPSLDEIATALQKDANFSTTITQALERRSREVAR